MSKPTVILVHGAWHVPAHYRDFLDILENKGYPCVAPSLPSGETPPPENPPEADIRRVREIAEAAADQGKEIIAVAHSYGGIVATEAFAGLGVETRAAEGKLGGVRWLVYVTAFMVGRDESLMDTNPPPDGLDKVGETQPDAVVPSAKFGDIFYSDVPHAERGKWMSLWRPCPIACALYVPLAQAYRDIDTAYVYCEDDMMVSIEVQRRLVRRAREVGVRIREESLRSGHTPSLSKPVELAEIVFSLP